MHVERWRISNAYSFKSSLAAPEFDAALEVRVEDPHAILPPKALDEAAPEMQNAHPYNFSAKRETRFPRAR